MPLSRRLSEKTAKRRTILVALYGACLATDLGLRLFAHPFIPFFAFLLIAILMGTRGEAVVGLILALAAVDPMDLLGGHDTPLWLAVGDAMVAVVALTLIWVVGLYRRWMKKGEALLAHLLVEQARVQEEVGRSEAALLAQRELILRANHGLRTPLTSICGYADMAERAVAKGDLERAARHIGRVRAQCRVLEGMLERVLAEEPSADPEFSSVSEALEVYAARHTRDARLDEARRETGAVVEDSEG